MNKISVQWYSPKLGRDLKVVRWGHGGRPVILFPTAGGDAEECERMLMIRALSPLIDEGRIRVWSVDHIAGWHWIDQEVHPRRKTHVQHGFDAFVSEELMNLVRRDAQDPHIRAITAGYSLGGFQAFASALRHPDQIAAGIAMSAPYDLSPWVEGHHDEHFHHTSPVHFLPYLDDPEVIRKMRETFLLLVHGSGRVEKPWRAWPVAQELGRKGIPNRVDIWSEDHDHDWMAWREQLPHYLDQMTR